MPRSESRFYRIYLDAVCYLPLLLRFHDPELMTIRAGEASVHVWHPVIGGPLWIGILAVYGAFLVVAVCHHLQLLLTGRPRVLPRALLLVSVTAAFALAGLVIDSLIVAIAVVTAYHNLQYLGLVWFHNRNRAEGEPETPNRPVRWLVSGKAWLYLVVTFAYGVVIIFPRAVFTETPLAQLPLAFVVAMHYYVDARVWRFNLYPERGRWLRLFAPKPA